MIILNLIGLYVLFQLTISLLFKPKTNILTCGIFVFMGAEPSQFNLDKFHILGTFNDSRGGDAVGIYKDDVLERSITPALYKNYALDINMRQLDYPLVIGHTRKASPGMGKTVEKAQPIVVSNKDKTTDIVLVHNGTIYNTDELAIEYDVPSANMTDSQVMAEIIAKGDYIDVLSEYRGGAALVWYDNRDSNLYVYHGKSKSSSYTTSVATEERPLFWLKENNHVYISSLKSPLELIAEDIDNVEEVAFNKLFTIDHSAKITEIATIDRSAASQSRYDYSNNNTSTVTDVRNLVEKLDFTLNNYKIIYCRGNYYFKNKPAHGDYYVDCTGRVEKSSDKTNFRMSFYAGVLIIPDTFKDLEKRVQEEVNKNETRYSRLVSEYALEPYQIAIGNKDKLPIQLNGNCKPPLQLFLYTANTNSMYYSGKVDPFFVNKQYLYSNGSFNKVITKKGIRLLTTTDYSKIKEAKDLYDGIMEEANKTAEEAIKVVNNSSSETIPAVDTVVCPACNGQFNKYSVADDNYECDICNNTGEVTSEVADSFESVVEQNLQSEADELEFTDLFLENILELTNIKDRLEYLENYLEDLGLELQDVVSQQIIIKGVNVSATVGDILKSTKELTTNIKKLN